MANDQQSDDEISPESGDVVEKKGFGLKLKNQREHLNMTLAEAASKLKLDVSFIDAIETEDFSAMSSTSYVYGYIRSYAKLLKLPEQAILDMYQDDNASEAQLLPDYMGKNRLYVESASKNSSWAFGLVVVIFLGLVTWWFLRQ